MLLRRADRQHACAEQFDTGAAVHGPFECFQPIDLTFGLAVAPGFSALRAGASSRSPASPKNEILPNGSRPPVWFALDESRPLALFAGIWTRWTSVRKVKESETTNDLFAFLTTEPNVIVAPIHAEAMPVILTTQEEVDLWMRASAKDALTPQRPLPDDALRIVARGKKQDGLPEDQPLISA